MESRRPYEMTIRADAAQSTADGILEVAIGLFTDKAYEEVTLEEVAAAPG